MIRTRALATVGMVVLAGAVVWRAAVSAENPAPHSSPFARAFDQHSVWSTWKIYCDTCNFGPKARANLNLEALDLANLDAHQTTYLLEALLPLPFDALIETVIVVPEYAVTVPVIHALGVPADTNCTGVPT